eukprot:5599547-Amphidinium_carterae.1
MKTGPMFEIGRTWLCWRLVVDCAQPLLRCAASTVLAAADAAAECRHTFLSLKLFDFMGCSEGGE